MTELAPSVTKHDPLRGEEQISKIRLRRFGPIVLTFRRQRGVLKIAKPTRADQLEMNAPFQA